VREDGGGGGVKGWGGGVARQMTHVEAARESGRGEEVEIGDLYSRNTAPSTCIFDREGPLFPNHPSPEYLRFPKDIGNNI